MQGMPGLLACAGFVPDAVADCQCTHPHSDGPDGKPLALQHLGHAGALLGGDLAAADRSDQRRIGGDQIARLFERWEAVIDAGIKAYTLLIGVVMQARVAVIAAPWSDR